MARAPFNVFVIPYRKNDAGEYEFAIFRRSDLGYWQFIAGGGEDDETPSDGARRESFEEAAIPMNSKYVHLDAMCTVAAHHFPDSRKHWDKSVYVIPNYCFAVDCRKHNIALSYEHTEFKWVEFDKCKRLLKWDSNITALWELTERLKNDDLPEAA